jgi:hypothetical protein
VQSEQVAWCGDLQDEDCKEVTRKRSGKRYSDLTDPIPSAEPSSKKRRIGATILSDWLQSSDSSESSVSNISSISSATFYPPPSPPQVVDKKVANTNNEFMAGDARLIQSLDTSVRKTFVEVFCGCGEMSFSASSQGFHAVAIDWAGNKDKPKVSNYLPIDLGSMSGVEAFYRHMKDLQTHGVLVFIHFAPPCGTASMARQIRRKTGPDPKPLRNSNFQKGFPLSRGKTWPGLKLRTTCIAS